MTTTALVRGRNARSNLPAPLVLAGGRQHSPDLLLKAWYESKSPHTVAAYQTDIEEFSLFVSRALAISPILKVSEALEWFFQQATASAHETVLHFRSHLERAGMAPSSINRHLSALRSLTGLARMLGVITWRIELPGVKTERRRDTRGPEPAILRQVLEAIDVRSEAGARDAAIIHTVYALAIRAAELCRLDLADLDVARGTLWVLGKGQREKVLLKVPDAAVEAISQYLRHRGTSPGPLFQTRGHRGKHRDGRLETRSVLRIIRTRGAAIGVKLWTHALRHSAITVAIEEGQKAGIGLHQVKSFSRHKNIATVMTYYDERHQAETQAQLATIVADSLR
jgi:integrase/recombinase XerC